MNQVNYFVIFKRDGCTVEVVPFESLSQATEYFEFRNLNWSEVYLCSIMRAGDRPQDTKELDTAPNTARDAIAALYEEALAIIKVHHGDVAWEIYRDHSPEMKRLRAKFDSAATAPVA